MENLTALQAQILAKAIASAWDDLPVSVEIEYGPETEKKAKAAVLNALESAEVVDVGIKMNEEQVSDLVGQFQVYLESLENITDLTRMEDELTILLTVE
jgi:hypothetical protein